MGKNYYNFLALFQGLQDRGDVSLLTYSNSGGHVLIGGNLYGCTFTVVADDSDDRKSLSLSVGTQENWQIVLEELQQLFTSSLEVNPICQYEIHSKIALHVLEWCLDGMDEEYLLRLVNGGGNYFPLHPKYGMELFNDRVPEDYRDSNYAPEGYREPKLVVGLDLSMANFARA